MRRSAAGSDAPPCPQNEHMPEELFCHEFVLVDLRVFENCATVCKGAQHVFNLAADSACRRRRSPRPATHKRVVGLTRGGRSGRHGLHPGAARAPPGGGVASRGSGSLAPAPPAARLCRRQSNHGGAHRAARLHSARPQRAAGPRRTQLLFARQSPPPPSNHRPFSLRAHFKQ